MTLQTTSVPENSTSDFDSDDSDLQDYITIIYILIISVLGIVGNVFVLLVFCLHKKACTVAEIYFSNLAAADLVLASCLPIWAAHIADNKFNWTFGSVLCKLYSMVIKMNACCSIYFLVLVSIDRYVALVHPMSYGRMRRPKYAKLGCVLVWGFGLLMSVPTIVYREVVYSPDYNATYCFLNYTGTHHLIFVGKYAVFSFIIPVCIISYCTVKIVQALSAMSSFRGEDTENKATFLVLAVLLAFIICWAPYHLISILEALQIANILKNDSSEIQDIFHTIFTYLAFFNSALNPILYVIVGKSFRKKVCELFKIEGFRADRVSSAPTSHAVELDTLTEK
ncbi:B2 bradykinin receptor-like [Genypterus blacodes]|uniref:B2 bradykinin receptor-like n=1 Tax=Genypterus blacodes TaxID=154954 RepID=UPI003F75E6A2